MKLPEGCIQHGNRVKHGFPLTRVGTCGVLRSAFGTLVCFIVIQLGQHSCR